MRKYYMQRNVKAALEKIKKEINEEYGFHEDTPRINYGPCGVFAKIFFDKWNKLFDLKSHICFILTPTKDECDHIVVRLPSGELYDGGIGIHTDDEYLNKFLIEEMIDYDEQLLEKWSYGLDRTYPRFCPTFNRDKVEKIVHSNLDALFKLTGSSVGIDDNIQLINPPIAENICREITSTLPEWFGIPEANEKYAKGMLERISFAAIENKSYVGLLTLEIPFPNNANIYWLGVKHKYHNKGIGTWLIKAAENYCREKGCNSLTVETLSRKAADENYLKTYHFYEKLNFQPLFEMYTYGPEHLMVYMQKIIN